MVRASDLFAFRFSNKPNDISLLPAMPFNNYAPARYTNRSSYFELAERVLNHTKITGQYAKEVRLEEEDLSRLLVVSLHLGLPTVMNLRGPERHLGEGF